jgi:catechol 2,3-dioxygenase-like lactoylglutathione lyase family enzyme
MPDEVAWQAVEPLPLTTYFPESGRIPSERSDVRIAYDDDYLYVGARLYDSNPAGIQAPTFRRNFDDLSTDSFGLVLDTFNNNETAVAFFVGPTGARSDFTISNDAEGDEPFNRDWDTFWDVETVRNEDGWFVEMIIPLSSLRFLERNGPGLHHVAYGTDDIDSALEAVRAAGLRLIDERPRTGIRNSRVAFVHPKSTGGVLTELVEAAH